MTSTAEAPVRPDLDVLRELEPVAERNLARHLSVAKEWMPHEYVPWSRGRDFDDLPWAPDQSSLTDVAQMAFEVNLLTEDNLPSYHREIVEAFGRDGVWGTWVHRWTAEEGRHSLAMRDYLLVTRGVDPVALERDRMQQVGQGYDSQGKTPVEALAYVSLQELATRISHRNTGAATQDPVAERLLSRVAADENLHMIFYRDLVSAALEIAPSLVVEAIATEVLRFAMPGTGIRDFDRKAKRIAAAGIYDLRIHHDEVVLPLLRQWQFFDLEGVDARAEQARGQVAEFLAGLDALATQHRERVAAKAARSGS